MAKDATTGNAYPSVDRGAGGAAGCLGFFIGNHISANRLIVRGVNQFEGEQSILTAVVVVFAMMMLRMGRPVRGNGFGIGVGLLVLCACDLVGRMILSRFMNVYSMYSLFNGSMIIAAVGVWVTYFVRANPEGA